MSTDHNRIKVADLEKGAQNQILVANTNGELEFSDINNDLDCTVPGKVLDARQGKVLQDSKVDKVTGKSLLSDTEITRLGTLSNYIHPVNHAPSIITQDINNRFVTDAEKAAWNAKQTNITAGTTAQYYRGDKTWQTLNKTAVGLASADNTADVAKNVLSATKLTTPRTINGTAFDGTANITINAADSTPRIPVSEKGVANGVATLDSSGIILTTQLPSYVDDVLEFTNLAGFPVTGETGKIYVANDTNKTYRWSGTAYIFITSGAVDSVAGKTGVVTLAKADVGLANADNTADAAKNVLSATKLTTARTINGTAFDGTANITINAVDSTKEPSIVAGTTAQYLRGDKTWQALDKTAVGLANVDNTSDLNKPVSMATQTALNLKANLASPNLTGVPTAPTATVGTNTTQIATTAFVLANNINIPHLLFNTTNKTIWNNGKGGDFRNLSYGSNSFESNSGGVLNTAIGNNTLKLSTTGAGNTALGDGSLSSLINGNSNIGVGYLSGSGITSGANNVCVGFASLSNITTGSNNTHIGYGGLSTGITTGWGNSIFGANVTGLSSTLTNNIILANGTGAIKAQHDGINWTFTGQINKSTLDIAPVNSTSTGILGEIKVTANYIYVCIATNTWVRSPLLTW